MKFLGMYRSAKPEGTLPTQEEMENMGKLIAEMSAEGVLVAAEGCLPSSMGAKVRRRDGKFTVTDGPFTEAKEIIGGYGIFQCNTKEEAIELTKRFLDVAGDGESEVRQIAEF